MWNIYFLICYRAFTVILPFTDMKNCSHYFLEYISPSFGVYSFILPFVFKYLPMKNALEVNFLWTWMFENPSTFILFERQFGYKILKASHVFHLVFSGTDENYSSSTILFFINNIFLIYKFWRSFDSLVSSFSICGRNCISDHLVWCIYFSYFPILLLWNYVLFFLFSSLIGFFWSTRAFSFCLMSFFLFLFF